MIFEVWHIFVQVLVVHLLHNGNLGKGKKNDRDDYDQHESFLASIILWEML